MRGTFKVSYVCKRCMAPSKSATFWKRCMAPSMSATFWKRCMAPWNVSYVCKRCMAPSKSATFWRDAWHLQCQLCLQETHGSFKVSYVCKRRMASSKSSRFARDDWNPSPASEPEWVGRVSPQQCAHWCTQPCHTSCSLLKYCIFDGFCWHAPTMQITATGQAK